jgi:hypothetical protein
MKATGTDYVTVMVSASEVWTFARSWPCSGFNSGDRMAFQFRRRTGDLVAIACNGRESIPARIDDSAMLALSRDAQSFAGL